VIVTVVPPVTVIPAAVEALAVDTPGFIEIAVVGVALPVITTAPLAPVTLTESEAVTVTAAPPEDKTVVPDAVIAVVVAAETLATPVAVTL
jgi:hypothetical protein